MMRSLWVALALLAVPPAARAQTEIANTVHNLTPGGSGQVKETRPTGLCVFCHTPHNARPSRANTATSCASASAT